MSKKTTETKLEKQPEKKPPTELTNDELDDPRGGGDGRAIGDYLVHVEADPDPGVRG